MTTSVNGHRGDLPTNPDHSHLIAVLLSVVIACGIIWAAVSFVLVPGWKHIAAHLPI